MHCRDNLAIRSEGGKVCWRGTHTIKLSVVAPTPVYTPVDICMKRGKTK